MSRFGLGKGVSFMVRVRNSEPYLTNHCFELKSIAFWLVIFPCESARTCDNFIDILLPGSHRDVVHSFC